MSKEAAFLWDESFLWGLMAYKSLRALDLPFDLVRAEDIKAEVLGGYRMLFVPGGWASNKSSSLGEEGIQAIREFVRRGGNYLGFCGGAGLAAKVKDGIGLLNVKRRPTKDRVPSFSGRIRLHADKHPMWEGLTELIFHAWWPSQFMIEDQGIEIPGTYGCAMPDAFSSDLNIGDVGISWNWDELENMYQINLDPARLKNEPAVVEGTYGRGKVVLSLLHFDTPDDVNGQRVLVNLWNYLSGAKKEYRPRNKGLKTRDAAPGQRGNEISSGNTDNDRLCSVLFALCSDLISLGERNFLWFWRNPMLLQWRRGVRGLEYNTLYIMMKEIVQITEPGTQGAERRLENTEKLLVPFVEKAKRLLILERGELQQGNYITYEKCCVPEINRLRKELFSDTKSHGGEFKNLLDELDRCVFQLLKNCD